MMAMITLPISHRLRLKLVLKPPVPMVQKAIAMSSQRSPSFILPTRIPQMKVMIMKRVTVGRVMMMSSI
ncbi:hypothetical protein D3C87_2112500 [compost metagenome]